MTDSSPSFERVALAYEISPGGPVVSASDQRRLYALYKQATVGDIQGDMPSLFNFGDQLKYRAWKDLRGMSRDEAKRQFVEVAHELGFRDPGEPPAPFISHETWLREESWPPPDFEDSSPCIVAPDPRPVTDEERARAPELATTGERPMPPEGSPEEHQLRLEQAGSSLAFHIHGATWPICCRRPATLVGFRGVDRDVQPALAEAYVLETLSDQQWAEADDQKPSTKRPKPYDDDQLANHLAAYHCANCGSVYLAGHEG